MTVLLTAVDLGCIENDDLENDDLENDDLEKHDPENDDLENEDLENQFWQITVKQKKKEKKREQRTFIRQKGDTWREVWLEVNRVSLQTLSMFVHCAIKLQMSYS